MMMQWSYVGIGVLRDARRTIGDAGREGGRAVTVRAAASAAFSSVCGVEP